MYILCVSTERGQLRAAHPLFGTGRTSPGKCELEAARTLPGRTGLVSAFMTCISQWQLLPEECVSLPWEGCSDFEVTGKPVFLTVVFNLFESLTEIISLRDSYSHTFES